MDNTKHYRYLIVGGGMTADAAVRGIRQADPDGSVGMISNEANPPYNRPPLTKGLWKKTPFERIWRGTEKLGLDLLLEREITQIDAQQKTATDNLGGKYSYDRLLLATGGSPVHLPFGGDNVLYYRYLPDYQRLRALAEEKQTFVVIGGGFIGSEIAAALRMHGKDVTMLFLDPAIGARLFPPDLAKFISHYYQEKGVRLLAGQGVQAVEARDGGVVVRSSTGEELLADAVVAGLGIRPNVALAQQIGLEINNGIVVDDHLRTSREDIYAAGDVISFFNSSLGKRLRVEHEEHANQSGLVAGQVMAGQEARYDFLPMAYSDLFELGYESVGELNPSLQVVQDWQEPFVKGVLYYLENGRVRGVLLWNVWSKTQAARDLIAAPGPFTPEDLCGKIQ